MAATNHAALKLLSGKRRQFQCCLQAVGNLFAIGFRYRNKYPDRVDLRDSEEFTCRAAISRIDEISDIGPPLRDDPIKWSNDALESLHLLKAAHVCIRIL